MYIYTKIKINTWTLIATILMIGIGCVQAPEMPMPVDSAVQSPLKKLLDGNTRFASLKPIHPDEDLQHLRDAAKEQHPFAVVVCCSDSRVSPELVLDQGIGDIFVIRTAGNILGGVEIGSIEYAVEHFGVKLVMVMGHENCGAIKAFAEGIDAPGHVKDIIDSIRKETEIELVPLDDKNYLDDCIIANVKHGIKQLQTQSTVISEKLSRKEIQLVAARYDLDDLTVSILN